MDRSFLWLVMIALSPFCYVYLVQNMDKPIDPINPTNKTSQSPQSLTCSQYLDVNKTCYPLSCFEWVNHGSNYDYQCTIDESETDILNRKFEQFTDTVDRRIKKIYLSERVNRELIFLFGKRYIHVPLRDISMGQLVAITGGFAE